MLEAILQKINKNDAVLIAVSKTRSIEQIKSIYDKGFRHFGENRARELEEKQGALPDDITWHMIGQLQKNKLKYIAGFVHYIHSVGSIELLEVIDKMARKHDRIIKVLLQIKIASEETKAGLTFQGAERLLDRTNEIELKNIEICGVMGMATFTNDLSQIAKEFSNLKIFFDRIKSKYFIDQDNFKEISMGMSGDYEIALEKGATMVRMGSLIFGPRK